MSRSQKNNVKIGAELYSKKMGIQILASDEEGKGENGYGGRWRTMFCWSMAWK